MYVAQLLPTRQPGNHQAQQEHQQASNEARRQVVVSDAEADVLQELLAAANMRCQSLECCAADCGGAGEASSWRACGASFPRKTSSWRCMNAALKVPLR